MHTFPPLRRRKKLFIEIDPPFPVDWKRIKREAAMAARRRSVTTFDEWDQAEAEAIIAEYLRQQEAAGMVTVKA